jgi:hypothetical protein
MKFDFMYVKRVGPTVKNILRTRFLCFIRFGGCGRVWLGNNISTKI